MLKQDGPRIAIAKFKSERACSAAEGIDAEQVCDVLMLADHYARPQLRTMALNFAVENCTIVVVRFEIAPKFEFRDCKCCWNFPFVVLRFESAPNCVVRTVNIAGTLPL